MSDELTLTHTAQRTLGRMRAMFDNYEDGVLTETEIMRMLLSELLTHVQFISDADGTNLKAHIPDITKVQA